MKKNGKYCNSKKGLNMKPLAVLLALTLLVGCAIGGTLAWLLDTSDTVVNTFTDSDITVTLTEEGATDNQQSFKMIPGYTIPKKAEAGIGANSEKAYLFVKVEKLNDFDNFMTYAIADGWTELTTGSGVYYRVVDTSTTAQSFSILAGDQVVVKSEVTKTMMDALSASNYPQMKFTAYASQLMKNNTDEFTPVEAWGNLNPATP